MMTYGGVEVQLYQQTGSSEEQTERLETKWIPHKTNHLSGSCLRSNHLHMSQLNPVQAFGAYFEKCIFSPVALFF
jgi:hypothetical protein